MRYLLITLLLIIGGWFGFVGLASRDVKVDVCQFLGFNRPEFALDNWGDYLGLCLDILNEKIIIGVEIKNNTK